MSGEGPDEGAELEQRLCLGRDKCKQYGCDGCRWNLDAIVECSYVRGDDVDVSEWELDAG